MFRLSLRNSCCLLLILVFAIPAESQFIRRRRDTGPQAKNISGVVLDRANTPIVSARVMVRDMKSKVVRTLTTDAQGRFSIFALPPTADYEVWAEAGTASSEKRLVSSFLNRQDNVFNFQLDIDAGRPAAPPAAPGPDLNTFDLVRLKSSFEMPTGVPAPVPSVLLLHGYGEDRSVWSEFRVELLRKGFAVLTVDLRGHGESRTRNQRQIEAQTDWRASSHEFPLDLDPALDYLKSQARVDNGKIIVIGSDVGANLALIASGRFPEVRTVVALNPKLSESLAMAGSAQDFQPRSALVISGDESEASRTQSQVRAPNRVLKMTHSGSTKSWFGQQALRDAIFAWIRETY